MKRYAPRGRRWHLVAPGRPADAVDLADRGLHAFSMSGDLAVVEKRLQQIHAAARKAGTSIDIPE